MYLFILYGQCWPEIKHIDSPTHYLKTFVLLFKQWMQFCFLDRFWQYLICFTMIMMYRKVCL